MEAASGACVKTLKEPEKGGSKTSDLLEIVAPGANVSVGIFESHVRREFSHRLSAG
jgi:hypothetical protein